MSGASRVAVLGPTPSAWPSEAKQKLSWKIGPESRLTSKPAWRFSSVHARVMLSAACAGTKSSCRLNLQVHSRGVKGSNSKALL